MTAFTFTLCIQAEVTRMRAAPSNFEVEERNELVEFLEYIESFWLYQIGISTMCVFGQEHRTNNLQENFHRHLNVNLPPRVSHWESISNYICEK